MEPVTIKDIAKALKLSTSTVSRALRDSYEINAETKRLVQEYATKMNPAINDAVPQSVTKSGSNLEYIYTKNKAATDVTYTVEWSDDLTSWSSLGVTSSVLTDGTTTQEIKALVPAGVTRRFVRLKVTRP